MFYDLLKGFFPLRYCCNEIEPTFKQWTGVMNGENPRLMQKPLTAVVRAKQSIKRQLHTTHVGAVGWEPHRSSPTRCAEKTDHGFGVCVPPTLICPLKIVT